MAPKDTPPAVAKAEAKPRATLKRATDFIAESFRVDDERAQAEQRGAVALACVLFGVDSAETIAHIDALRAKAKADATLAALTGKGK